MNHSWMFIWGGSWTIIHEKFTSSSWTDEELFMNPMFNCAIHENFMNGFMNWWRTVHESDVHLCYSWKVHDRVHELMEELFMNQWSTVLFMNSSSASSWTDKDFEFMNGIVNMNNSWTWYGSWNSEHLSFECLVKVNSWTSSWTVHEQFMNSSWQVTCLGLTNENQAFQIFSPT